MVCTLMTDQCGILLIMIRKNLPKTALPRLYYIDREIASGTFPSTRKLAKQYEISMSTISRDIEYMRDMLDAPIEYNAFHRGYYYTSETFRLPAGFANPEDLLALGMAKSILTLYQDTPLYGAAKHLLDMMTLPLVKGRDRNSLWFENRIIVPPVASAPVSAETWNTILQALEVNRVITFEYQGLWDEEYKPRRVRPYQILFDNGVWYLHAYAEERKDLRIFSLTRIKNTVLRDETFSLPANYDYCTLTDGSCFGVFAGGRTYDFRIEFFDESCLWVQERTWASDQVIKETEEGVSISFTSSQYNKVLEWMLSRGSSARPLAPEVLVEEWRWHIEEMGKMVRGG